MWILCFETISHKHDFEVGWGGWGGPCLDLGWSSSKETNLFYQINSYLQFHIVYYVSTVNGLTSITRLGVLKMQQKIASFSF